jgi:hypothetical protein
VLFLGGKSPQKSWRNNFRVRVRTLTVMDIYALNFMPEPTFPVEPSHKDYNGIA